VKPETTDRLVSDMLSASRDVGAAPRAPTGTDPLEQAITSLVDHLREGNGGGGDNGSMSAKHPVATPIIKYAITALLALGAAYGGIKLAVKHNADSIEMLDAKIEMHDASPAHDGAVTKQEFQEVRKEVRDVEKKVDNIGVKIDERAKAQMQQYDDIKDELRYLRRRRNRGD